MRKVVLVRYGEIGVKSDSVRGKMVKVLRQRIEDRLEYQELPYQKVMTDEGRIFIYTEHSEAVAKAVSEIPGVASASPSVETEANLEKIKQVAEAMDFGESFGVRTNRAGEHQFNSREVNQKIGAHIEEVKEIGVELDNPDTWLDIDIRYGKAYVFTEIFEGPQGHPVSSEKGFLSLISGGIDSPVAAHQVLTRGVDIMPIYFFNKPISAEDHLIRFESVVKKLERFHPGKKWHYYVVDMEEVNNKLMDVGKGRMVLHRAVMFKVAERIAEREGLQGIVTGESIGQKASQTPKNLAVTSSQIDMPVHRPLLTWDKNRITEKARDINTFEESKIDSACRTIAPESPATSLDGSELEALKSTVGFEKIVDKAVEQTKKVEL